MAADVAREIYELAKRDELAEQTAVRMEIRKGVEATLGSNTCTLFFDKKDGGCFVRYSDHVNFQGSCDVFETLCQRILCDLGEETGFIADFHYLEISIFYKDTMAINTRYTFNHTFTRTDLSDYKTMFKGEHGVCILEFLLRFYSFSESLVNVRKIRRSRYV